MAGEGQSVSSPLLVGPMDVNGVRQFTLNRPERANAFGAGLGDALLDALHQAHRDGTRVLVLRANGKNFCGGFDFTGYEQLSEGDLLLRFVRIEQVLQRLRDAPFVTIARTHHAAFGAGADLVAACTLRVGAHSARFRFPGYRFGVALGTRRLALVIGQQRAQELLLANATLDSEQALACGLLTHRVADEQLDAVIAGIVAGVSDLDAEALAALLANASVSAPAGDRELASLVRSVARPGIHARIGRYLAATAPPRAVPEGESRRESGL